MAVRSAAGCGTGHLGAAVDTYRNTYGIVAEEDVIIRMNNLTVSGELRDLGGPDTHRARPVAEHRLPA